MEMDKLTLSAFLCLMLSVFMDCFNVVHANLVDVECTTNFGNFDLSSPFAANVRQVLQNLISNTAVSGFNNTSVGESSQDRVYGQAFCRGDVGDTDCQNCIKDASSQILINCSTKDAIIWNDKCQLRYSGRNFFSDTEYGGKYPPSIYNETLASDPVRFYSYVKYLLNNISNDAVRNTSMFATGDIIYSEKQTIYGLVQCAREMSSEDCNSCLGGAMGDLQACCSSREGGTIVGKYCNVRFQVYQFYNGSSAYHVTYPTQKGNGKKWVIVIVACVLGLILIALAGSSVIAICKRKNDQERTVEELYNDLVTPVGVTINQAGDLVGSEELPFMDLNIIKGATDDFSMENKLGQGGFGTVYKGVLPDGKEVAVKRLSRKSWQGLEEFKNEIKLIAKLQHKNLVRLVGCALEGDEKLLVYEYVPNKSLDMFIFNEERRLLLNWKACHAIIDGIARGLVYLHEDSRLRIIHRDLKPSNVLLDSEMVAKISDFGMARIFGENQNTANTKRVVGTYGYMAPEYAMGGLFSVKSDVFSFGVIVFEILSGKRNSGFHHTGLAQTLLAYAWRLWNEGRGLELVDSSLVESGSADEILRCIHIGLLCVQEDPADRPTMSEIITLFNNKTWNPPQPNQPAFSTNRVVPGPEQSSDNTSCSVNELTVSSIFPR